MNATEQARRTARGRRNHWTSTVPASPTLADYQARVALTCRDRRSDNVRAWHRDARIVGAGA